MDGSLVIMEGSLLSRFFLLQWMLALLLQKVVCCRYFGYSNGWQHCHYGRQPCNYGRQSVVEIFVTSMDGSLVVMEGRLLSRLLLQWMTSLSLWKVVCCRDFCYSNGWYPYHYGRQPCNYGSQSVVEIFDIPLDGSLIHYGRQYVLEIFFIPIDGSLVIMEGSLFSRFLLLQWMVALSLWNILCFRDFCYSNGWQPCHYGRQSVIEISVTPLDGSLVIIEGSLSSIFLLFQWMVALSFWQVVCCRDFCYSNGWQPCHYGRQSIIEFFVIPMDGRLVIMEGSLLLIFLILQWMVAL